MERQLVRNWVRVGAISGVASVVTYVSLLLPWRLPAPVLVALAATFGLLFSTTAVGGYYFIALHRKTVTLQLGTLFNVIAGTMVNTMLVVQLALGQTMRGYMRETTDAALQGTLRWIWRSVDQVQLGLDVVWDVYVAVGTFLIALNMVAHPRFGRAFGYSGAVIALALLVFNLWTFPTPPAAAGSIDLGPLLGLWGLAVSIQILRSLGWADERTTAQAA